jgi:RNA polymerase sigma-70 factor (ECF subfamily)
LRHGPNHAGGPAEDPVPESDEQPADPARKRPAPAPPSQSPSQPSPAPAVLGAPAAREEFARRFAESYRTLWTIAAGIVNDPAVAEDVVQDAAVTALGKLHEFRPESNFTAWMAQIVRFIALNTSRRGRRQPTPLDPIAMDDSMSMSRQSNQHPPISMPGVGSAGDSRGTPLVDSHGHLDAGHTPFDDRVMRALNSVSEIARACLLLRTIEGLNYDEIARALQIPPGTAMSHVHRTRIFLRERLADLEPLRGHDDETRGGSDR